MADPEQGGALSVFICEKTTCKTAHSPTEALIGLVEVYSDWFLYMIVAFRAFFFFYFLTRTFLIVIDILVAST